MAPLRKGGSRSTVLGGEKMPRSVRAGRFVSVGLKNQMAALFRTFAALTALTICSIDSYGKVFDLQHMPKNINQLRNGDNFSVECKSNRTGVIDRESVDVDSATVTVEIPGREPIVHHITRFSMGLHGVQDRFGQPGTEFYVQAASWGQIGASAVGLLFSGDRWVSHHEDDTWWTCAN